MPSGSSKCWASDWPGVARYLCNGALVNHAARDRCIAFGNMRIDTAVSAEVLRAIAPLGIEAALAAIEAGERVSTERIDQLTSALEQACYEAARAGRQYNTVEPENRIVAAELERRWNERLGEVERLEAHIRTAQEMQASLSIAASERAELMALADDLPRAWNHPGATAETRKRILRTVLEEIVVRVGADHLQLKLHWAGRQSHCTGSAEDPSRWAPLEDQHCGGTTDPRLGSSI